MRYEKRVVDAEKGIVQVTTEDERFYSKTVDGKTIWIPSVTWICDHYPKGVGFYKWLSAHGWDEAEALKEAAGDRGSYIHYAVNLLLSGKSIAYNAVVEDRELTTDEYAAVMSFIGWFNEYRPKVVKTEYTVFSPDNRYAGTLDLLCEIKDKLWIIDFKSSADIWPPHRIQISAYKHALDLDAKLGILQLGYRRNIKKKWKFTEIEDDMELFEAAYRIWQRETSERVPLQRDYPLELKIDLQGGDK